MVTTWWRHHIIIVGSKLEVQSLDFRSPSNFLGYYIGIPHHFFLLQLLPGGTARIKETHFPNLLGIPF